MLKQSDVRGVYVPVVTPFLPDGQLDLESYRRYVRKLVEHDINGLVINGTTGESPTLAWEEVCELVRATQQELTSLGLQKSLPIIVGTGTNDTLTTVKRTERAGELGADAVLVVTPYYSRPPQEGIVEHYRRTAQVGVPVIAYEVPARTGVRVTTDTMNRILDLDDVIGLKDSSGGLELIEELNKSRLKPVLCGEDILFRRMLALGASGGILASANVCADSLIHVSRLASQGDYQGADDAFDKLVPLIRKLFQESNPAPLKWLLAKQGLLASDTLRLPMSSISWQLQLELEQELEQSY
jgi:4-hydroxy-tetrahydrodipicolinate synthase